MLAQLPQSGYFMICVVSSIFYRPTDLSLLFFFPKMLVFQIVTSCPLSLPSRKSQCPWLASPQWWGFEDKGQLGGWFLLKNSESQIKIKIYIKLIFEQNLLPVDPFSQKYTSEVTATWLLSAAFWKIITALKSHMTFYNLKLNSWQN